MMKQILAYFLLVTSFLWSISAHAQDFIALRETGSGHVIEVITPYLIQIDNGQIVRLSGIHYPDYKLEQAGEFSLTALAVLKDMLVGAQVGLYQTPKKSAGRENRMGHQLAHLHKKDGGLWVQGVLLSLGLAQVKTSARNPELAATMLGLEAEVRAETLGIWENEGVILTPEKAGEHLNSFQIVEGRIESVALKKNRLYINFGKNWKEDFTVSIPPESLRRFSQAGLDPLQWNGKRVRVRGWLESYNGPLIEIDHPAAFEFPDDPALLHDLEKPPVLDMRSSDP